MTKETIEIRDHDLIQPFMLEGADVHGRVVELDSSVHAILSKHTYPQLIESLLGITQFNSDTLQIFVFRLMHFAMKSLKFFSEFCHNVSL